MRQLKITKQVTNRETASLDKYLQEIGKVDLITADEEVELAQKIKAGDQSCPSRSDLTWISSTHSPSGVAQIRVMSSSASHQTSHRPASPSSRRQ